MKHEQSGKTLVGSGDASGCYEIIGVVWQDKTCHAAVRPKSVNDNSKPNQNSKEPCYLGDIQHPPLNGRFYAMSVYFYALDAVQHLGSVKLKHWPTPTLYELKEAVESFCETHWEEAKTWLNRAHRYTQDRNVPNRCVESMYMVTLLEHAFGYDEHGRNITFALNIEGQEVEWTLGFVLANVSVGGEHGLHRYERPSGTPTVRVSDVSRSYKLSAIAVRVKSVLTSLRNLLFRILPRFERLRRQSGQSGQPTI